MSTGTKVALWIMGALILAGATFTIIFFIKNKKLMKVNEELKKALPASPTGAGNGTTTTTTNTTVTTGSGGNVTIPAGTPIVETANGKKFVALN